MTDRNDDLERTKIANPGGSAAGPNEFAVGDIVGGAYEVLAFIGAGGMGNVYRVRHTMMNTQYALKTLSVDQVTEQAWRRFQNEAQAIARMNHPNVVAIYNLGLHDKVLPYYVMDLLKGQSLMDRLKTKTKLKIEEALPIFIEACAGIGYAHKKGIVHRDIKPGNIIILDTPDATGARVKIVDFGIAKLSHTKDAANQGLTSVGEICGSPFYMSPEQSEAIKVDARSDIYSLGCTLYETLTGHPPFRGRNATETIMMHHTEAPPALSADGEEFPEQLEGIVAATMAKVPMDRYQTTEQLALELGEVLHGIDYVPEVNRAKFKPNAVVIMCAIIAVIVTTAGVIFYLNGRSQRPTISADQAPELSKVAPAKLATEVNSTPPPGSDGAPPLTEAQLADATPFSTITPDKNNVPVRHFKFPSDRVIGEMSCIWTPTHRKDCRGDVDFFANLDLQFEPGLPMAIYPQLWNRFRPDEINKIEIALNNEGDMFDNRTIKYISRLKGLKRLTIAASDKIDNTCLPYLDSVPSLMGLDLHEVKNLTVAGLARSATLKHLKELTLETDESITPVLEALRDNHQLTYLDLTGLPLSEKDMSIINKLPSVITLKLNKCHIDDDKLALLVDMPKIQELQIDKALITERSIPVLQKILGKNPKINTSLRAYGFGAQNRLMIEIESRLHGIHVYRDR